MSALLFLTLASPLTPLASAHAPAAPLPSPLQTPHEALGWALSQRPEATPLSPGPVFPVAGAPVPPPAPGSNLLDVYTYNDLVVMKDPDGAWFSEAIQNAGRGNLDWILNSIYGAFYQDFGDDYQYLTILMVRDLGFFFAFYSPMANDIQGIGYDTYAPREVFDNTTDTQVEGMIFMNYYGLWAENPEAGRYVFGQEFMHRWGAFVNVPERVGARNLLLGRDTAHWSYWMDTTNSPMEGNRWLDNGDGTWSIDPSTGSLTPDSASGAGYSPFDRYLMGFVTPEEVGPLRVLDVSAEEQARVGREPASPPEAFLCMLGEPCGGITVAATPIDLTIDDIIEAEGPRVPAAADSPRSFRMAYIVLLLSDDPGDAATLDAVAGVRDSFTEDWGDDVDHAAEIDTTLGDNTAPVWGEATTDDSGADSGTDSATDDTTDGTTDDTDSDEEASAKGCGCANAGISPDGRAGGLSLLPLVVGMVGYALSRATRPGVER